MVGIIIIGIIVFVIWIIVKFKSSNNSSVSSTTNYNYQREFDLEQEKIAKEHEEEIRKTIAGLIRIQEERRRKELEFGRQKEQTEQQKQLAQRQKRWKDDWRDYQRFIDEYQITKLYHFTDRANLFSIKQNGGLYSWDYCERNHISISLPGGDDFSRSLDMRYNLQNYVRLSFTKNHPMMYVAKNQGRINDPVILEINPEVIYWKGTKYSDMNATKTGHSKGDTIEDFKKIKFDIVKQSKHFDVSEELQKYYQAEIMVKEHIPLAFIINFDDFHIKNEQQNTYFDYEDDFPF